MALNANHLAIIISNAEIAALKRYEGLIKDRIHIKGQFSSGQIGVYSSDQYKKRRQKSRRQIAYVDLEFTGDMRKGYSVGITEDEKTNALGFLNDVETAKGEHNVTRYGQVFFPTTDEDTEAEDSYLGIIEKQLANVL